MNVKDLKKKQEDGIIGQYNYPGLVIIRMCLRILGGQKDNLIKAFEKATEPLDKIYNTAPYYMLPSILPLLADNMHDIVDESASCNLKVNDISIEYKVKTDRWVNAELVSPDPESVSFEIIKRICIEAVNSLDKKGLLY
ncbi:MAG: hypothetical protein LBV26_06395 [Bacteroidales bacterium]|nr:hypothetical protein [Bacteroidales bacterium]